MGWGPDKNFGENSGQRYPQRYLSLDSPVNTRVRENKGVSPIRNPVYARAGANAQGIIEPCRQQQILGM